MSSAQQDWQEISDSELAAAKAQVARQAAALERFVNPRTANGQRWLSFLRWETLQEQLAAGSQFDRAALAGVLDRLESGENGLEMSQFRGLAISLRRYINLAAAKAADEPAAAYARVVEGLGEELNQYAQQATVPLEISIGRRLDVLNGLGFSPQLVAAVQQQYIRPNAFIAVSADILRKVVDEPVEDVGPVSDYILGTTIRGTARTTGEVSMRLVPSTEAAVIEFASQGDVVSNNTGYNGPVVIYNSGYTDYAARVRVELTDPYFRSYRARVSATTHSDIHSIRSRRQGLGSRLIERIARGRAAQDKPRADAIASDHAEERIGDRFDEEVLTEVRALRRRYNDFFRNPLLSRGDLPGHTRFSSTADAMHLEVTQANQGQLGAASEPPAAPSGHALVARVHESAVNNYLASLLGGATLSEPAADADMQIDVSLPDWVEDLWEEMQESTESDEEEYEDSLISPGVAQQPEEPEFRPWSLQFRRLRPITVRFSGDQAQIIVHAAEIRFGEDIYEDWDLTATYQLHPQNGGMFLIRQGDPDAWPQDFDPESGAQLRSADIPVRSNLRDELIRRADQGDGFRDTFEIPMLEPSGDLADVGPLWLRVVTGQNGWLTLAWDSFSQPAGMPAGLPAGLPTTFRQ